MMEVLDIWCGGCVFFLSTFSPAYMVYYIYVVVVA